MENIINKFNELLQEMANAVAEAKSTEEAEKLQAKWDKDIDKAEKEMQEELEAFIKAQDDALLAEQKAVEDKLKKLEKEFEATEAAIKKEEAQTEIDEDFILSMKEKDLIEYAATKGLTLDIQNKKKYNQEKLIEHLKK